MKPDDNADVIERILKKAAPIKGPVGASLSTMVWVACSLLAIAVTFASTLVLRSDLTGLTTQIWFVANMAALAAVFVFASYAGFVSALPGRPQPWVVLLALQLALLVFFLTLMPSILHLDWASGLRLGLSVGGLRCSCTLAALGIIPGLLLYFSLKRLAPVNPGRTASMIGLAMGAMGAFGLGLDCMVMTSWFIMVCRF